MVTTMVTTVRQTAATKAVLVMMVTATAMVQHGIAVEVYYYSIL